jgi:hypothetical protein
MREVLFGALVLACPLMMIFMMRGGHGHGGGHAGHAGGRHGGHDHEAEAGRASTDELRRRRDELDRLIEERQRSEEPELGPAGSGRR